MDIINNIKFFLTYTNLNELLLLYIFHILKEDLAKFKKSS